MSFFIGMNIVRYDLFVKDEVGSGRGGAGASAF
jgi:hypothetical protein